jgi:hypothetical protein
LLAAPFGFKPKKKYPSRAVHACKRRRMKNGQFLKKGDLMKDEPDETRDEEEEMEIFTNTNDDALTLLPPSSF